MGEVPFFYPQKGVRARATPARLLRGGICQLRVNAYLSAHPKPHLKAYLKAYVIPYLLAVAFHEAFL